MMLHVGLENWINSDKIIAIKKFTNGSRVANKILNEQNVINMAGTKKTKSLVLIANNIAIRSMLSPETLVKRMDKMIDYHIESTLTESERV